MAKVLVIDDDSSLRRAMRVGQLGRVEVGAADRPDLARLQQPVVGGERLLVRRDRRGRLLDVEVEDDTREPFQHLAQCGDPELRVIRGTAAVGVLGHGTIRRDVGSGNEPVGEIEMP